MKKDSEKIKIGILGCGAIGSRIAKSIKKELREDCLLTGIFDIDPAKGEKLQKTLCTKKILKNSLPALLKSCKLVVEAINAKNTKNIIRQVLMAKKHVLVMSSGTLIQSQNLLKLAKQNKCSILIPSGAIAGIDAIKSASLAGIDKMTITTKKPPGGFKNNPYLIKKRIDLSSIKSEKILFEGNVLAAVKAFPQNINVAATLALASNCSKKLKIKILTSPKFKSNTHEIEIQGKSGQITTKTENVICPDNLKTSYLASLSGVQTLKQFCEGIFIGT